MQVQNNAEVDELMRSKFTTFTMNAWLNDHDHLNPDAIQDIMIVCRYTCSFDTVPHSH